MKRRVVAALLVASGCVYFNTMYNAREEFGRARQLHREGDPSARVALDSVIAKSERVMLRHPDSKYADDAALLKARSEIMLERWAAAFESARAAVRLAGDPGVRATALGLQGTAAYSLRRYAPADSLLTLALAADLDPDDAASFRFARGRTRLALGRPEEAAADLREASQEEETSAEARLDLAVALAAIGAYDESVSLTKVLLQSSRAGDLNEAERTHVDSLIARVPEAMETALTEIAADESQLPARRALFLLLRGLARERSGDGPGSIEDFDTASRLAIATRAGGEAAYHAAHGRLEAASTPDSVRETLGSLLLAERVGPQTIRPSARRMREAVQRFSNLMGAWESRGDAAAEALIRAAEVAATDLEANRVARDLYVRYVASSSDSPWLAKAIIGALSLGAADSGTSADEAALRSRLRAIPATDPYRSALRGDTSAAADSAYARAERRLATRLDQIRALFEPTAVTPAEPAADEPDSARAGREAIE
ncbi:MAG: tetratricopeptide repeat protein [Gemmatimonadota bacterium]